MIQEEGPGWRLARDPSRGKFPYLIGGDNWAIELTESEWQVFVSVVFDLVSQLEDITDQLVPEEAITLEIERQSWWCCLDGSRDYWNLKFVLQDENNLKRDAEGFWPVPAAQAMTSALRIMWESFH